MGKKRDKLKQERKNIREGRGNEGETTRNSENGEGDFEGEELDEKKKGKRGG